MAAMNLSSSLVVASLGAIQDIKRDERRRSTAPPPAPRGATRAVRTGGPTRIDTASGSEDRLRGSHRSRDFRASSSSGSSPFSVKPPPPPPHAAMAQSVLSNDAALRGRRHDRMVSVDVGVPAVADDSDEEATAEATLLDAAYQRKVREDATMATSAYLDLVQRYGTASSDGEGGVAAGAAIGGIEGDPTVAWLSECCAPFARAISGVDGSDDGDGVLLETTAAPSKRNGVVADDPFALPAYVPTITVVLLVRSMAASTRRLYRFVLSLMTMDHVVGRHVLITRLLCRAGGFAESMYGGEAASRAVFRSLRHPMVVAEIARWGQLRDTLLELYPVNAVPVALATNSAVPSSERSVARRQRGMVLLVLKLYEVLLWPPQRSAGDTSAASTGGGGDHLGASSSSVPSEWQRSSAVNFLWREYAVPVLQWLAQRDVAECVAKAPNESRRRPGSGGAPVAPATAVAPGGSKRADGAGKEVASAAAGGPLPLPPEVNAASLMTHWLSRWLPLYLPASAAAVSPQHVAALAAEMRRRVGHHLRLVTAGRTLSTAMRSMHDQQQADRGSARRFHSHQQRTTRSRTAILRSQSLFGILRGRPPPGSPAAASAVLACGVEGVRRRQRGWSDSSDDASQSTSSEDDDAIMLAAATRAHSVSRRATQHHAHAGALGGIVTVTTADDSSTALAGGLPMPAWQPLFMMPKLMAGVVEYVARRHIPIKDLKDGDGVLQNLLDYTGVLLSEEGQRQLRNHVRCDSNLSEEGRREQFYISLDRAVGQDYSRCELVIDAIIKAYPPGSALQATEVLERCGLTRSSLHRNPRLRQTATRGVMSLESVRSDTVMAVLESVMASWHQSVASRSVPLRRPSPTTSEMDPLLSDGVEGGGFKAQSPVSRTVLLQTQPLGTLYVRPPSAPRRGPTNVLRGRTYTATTQRLNATTGDDDNASLTVATARQISPPSVVAHRPPQLLAATSVATQATGRHAAQRQLDAAKRSIEGVVTARLAAAAVAAAEESCALRSSNRVPVSAGSQATASLAVLVAQLEQLRCSQQAIDVLRVAADTAALENLSDLSFLREGSRKQHHRAARPPPPSPSSMQSPLEPVIAADGLAAVLDRRIRARQHHAHVTTVSRQAMGLLLAQGATFADVRLDIGLSEMMSSSLDRYGAKVDARAAELRERMLLGTIAEACGVDTAANSTVKGVEIVCARAPLFTSGTELPRPVTTAPAPPSSQPFAPPPVFADDELPTLPTLQPLSKLQVLHLVRAAVHADGGRPMEAMPQALPASQ